MNDEDRLVNSMEQLHYSAKIAIEKAREAGRDWVIDDTMLTVLKEVDGRPVHTVLSTEGDRLDYVIDNTGGHIPINIDCCVPLSRLDKLAR